MLNPNSKPVITCEILDQNNLKNEIYLFDTKSNKGYMIDGIACLIITMIDGNRSIYDILDQIKKSHDINIDKFQSETESLFTDLVSKNLIKIDEH